MSINSPSVEASQRKFRQDINALRAWAVISVVLYHFGALGFSGGFLGVDIFFVISGFLMTGIIVSGLETQKFSIFTFYFARVKRIIPALIVLCLVLLFLGWFLLAPDDYATLAKHVKDSLLFVSNETYRKESGYFDSLSHEKWLLHTWSLSVEWQFYLLLPLVLSGAWLVKKSRRWLLLVVVILLLYSLIVCINKTYSAPTKAFYLIKYRYWEMLAGGVAFFLSDYIRRVPIIYRNALYLLSLVCISVPVFFITKDSAWPGYLALIPVLGAAGFILSERNNSSFINNAIVVWAGERSYSIYLWHWPVVVLLDYFQLLSNNLYVFVGVLTSFFLAELSYKFVEMPFRAKAKLNIWRLPILIVAAGLLVCTLAAIVIHYGGVPKRVDQQVVKIAAEKNNIDRGNLNCIFGDDKAKGPSFCEYGQGEVKAVVLGDSHAAAIAGGVYAALPNATGKVLLLSRAACPFIRGATAKIDQNCDVFWAGALEKLKAVSPNVPVVLIERSSLYAMGANEGVVGTGKVKPPIFFDKPFDYPAPEFLEQFRQHSLDTLCEVAKNRKLYWLKPIPELKINVPQAMARTKMRGIEKRVGITRTEYAARHDFILSVMKQAQQECGVVVLDPLPYLCDEQACYGDKDGFPVYFDDDHLSRFGNRLLVPLFQEIF